MVIDDLHTRFGRSPARQDRGEAVHRAAPRRQRPDGGSCTPPAPTNANQEFTSNKRLLLAAVDKTQGRKLDSATANKTNEYYRTRDTAPAGRSAERSGRRGARVQRAQHARHAQERRGVVRRRSAAAARRSCSSAKGSTTTSTTSFRRPDRTITARRWSSTRRATRLRPRRGRTWRSTASIRAGLTDLGDESIEIERVPRRHVARHRTGIAAERAAPVTGQPANALGRDRRLRGRQPERLLDGVRSHRQQDNSSYYVLAYYPPDARPGRAHKIDVRMTRPGLTVRARKGYVTPKKTTRRGGERERHPGRRKCATRIDSPLPVSGLTMHVFAAPFKGTAPNASVLLGVELRGRDLKLDPNAKILLSYVAYRRQRQDSRREHRHDDDANLKPETKDAHRADRRADAEPVRICRRAAISCASRRTTPPAATSVRCSTTSTCRTSSRRRSASAGW